MTKAKARGTAFESAVVDVLNAAGLSAYRPAQHGRDDQGDIHGVSPFIVQCKNYADVATALRLGVEGARVQAANAGERYGVAVVKRRGKHAREAYAVMRLEDFAALILELRRT